MKNKIFSVTLYWQNMKKVRTLGIAMMISIVLLNLILPINAILKHKNDLAVDIYRDGVAISDDTIEKEHVINIVVDSLPKPKKVPDASFAPFLWAMVLFAPLMVWMMFSFLNERKKSDFYHALPQTRICVYLSMLAAILTWFAAVIIMSVGINAILWSFAKRYTFTGMTVLSNMVFYFVLAFFLAAFMAVAMMITGTTLSNVLTFFFLLLFPRYIIQIYFWTLEGMTDILISPLGAEHLFSFCRFLPFFPFSGNMEEGYFADVPMLLYSFVMGILLFGVACVLYHVRRSESATKSAPNDIWQHIYRILYCTAVTILIPYAMSEASEEIGLWLFLGIAAVVVYLLYELMTTKKIAKMIKSLPLLVVPFLLAGIFGLSAFAGKAYIYSIRPETEDVKAVRVYKDYESSYRDYLLRTSSWEDTDVIDLVLENFITYLDDGPYTGEDGINTEWCTVKFEMKNGDTIGRQFVIKKEAWDEFCSMTKIYDKLPDQNTAKISVHPYLAYVKEESLSSGIDMAEVTEEAWRIFTEEYTALTIAEKQLICELYDAWYMINEYSYYFEVSLVNEEKMPNIPIISSDLPYRDNYYFALIPELTPKTIEYLMSFESKEDILATMEEMKTSETDFAAFSITYQNKYGNYRTAYIGADDFLDAVTFDDHLFGENGNDVMIVMNDIDSAYWFKLTDEELDAIKTKTHRTWDYPISIEEFEENTTVIYD